MDPIMLNNTLLKLFVDMAVVHGRDYVSRNSKYDLFYCRCDLVVKLVVDLVKVPRTSW